MTKWLWKRWVWAVLAGTALAVGSGVVAQVGRFGAGIPATKSGPKVNDTITLKFPGQPDRKVRVVKATPMRDGSIETEVVDPMTGSTFTLVEPPPTQGAAPPPSATPVGQKSRTADPLLTSRTAPTPQPSAPVMASEPKKKPGLLSRVFGKKPAPTTAMPGPVTSPNAVVTPPNAPVPAPLMQPAPRPVVNAPAPMPMPSTPIVTPPPLPASPPKPTVVTPAPLPKPMPATAPVANEPPILTPPKPMPTAPIPPAPAIPPAPVPTVAAPVVPAPLPTTPPVAAPAPIPAPIPSPAPAPIPKPAPAIPATGGGTLPTIPPPPGGLQSTAMPVSPTVIPASHVPAPAAVPADAAADVKKLKSAIGPSQRMTAAEALADSPHGSSEAVTSALFKAAQSDPCPAVRACCMEQLCKLKHYKPEFIDLLKSACNDPSDEVKSAATAALQKMTAPQK